MIRILIVDDQNLVQQGIKSLLDRELDFKVIGAVRNGRNAVQQIAQIHPDIVLLDIEMPGMDGITATKYINQISPKTKVIILSSHEEKKYVTRALMAGAKGYILKNSLMTDLKQAIIAVHNGYSQIDSRLLAKVFDPQSIKSKKNRAAAKNDLNQKKKQNLSNNKNNQVVETSQTNSQKATLPTEINSPALSTKSLENANTHKAIALESDTKIQSNKSGAISIEKAISPKQPGYISNNIADAVVLEQVKPREQNSSQANIQPKTFPIAVSNVAIAPVKPESHRLKRKSNKLSRKLKQKTSAIIPYLKQLSDHPKISVHKPKIYQLKSKLEPYKTKLWSWLRQKRNQEQLWNICLIILGIVIVLLIGKL